jgi:hypothetical protein
VSFFFRLVPFWGACTLPPYRFYWKAEATDVGMGGAGLAGTAADARLLQMLLRPCAAGRPGSCLRRGGALAKIS